MRTLFLGDLFMLWLVDLLFTVSILSIIVYVAWLFSDWRKTYVSEESIKECEHLWATVMFPNETSSNVEACIYCNIVKEENIIRDAELCDCGCYSEEEK